MRERDVRHVCQLFSNAPADVVKIVVAHLSRCGTDVFLTGHLHISYAGGSATRYRAAGRSAIIVEAGTAISTRMRGEPNGFTLLQIRPQRIDVVPFQWQDAAGTFKEGTHQAFARVDDSWEQA